MSNDYTVQQGDCIDSIAFEHGLLPDTIWAHSANQALRAKRTDPNLLQPGDTLVIPDKTPRIETRPCDAKHTFVRKGVPAKLELQVLDNMEPVADTPFELLIEGKTAAQGNTDGNGVVRCPIPPNAQTGVLLVKTEPEPLRYDLELGALDPYDADSGVRGRLANLGFGQSQDPADNRNALILFQKKMGLKPTGELDGPTKNKIEELHENGA